MEYHQDRFTDASLVVFKNDKLEALFPANMVDNIVYSHQGLTYGGLIFKPDATNQDVKKIFKAIINFYAIETQTKCIIKEIPEMYYRSENKFIKNFLTTTSSIDSTNMVLAIDYSNPLLIHKTKLKHLRKSDRFNLKIKESRDFEPFWNKVLKPRLSEKHNVKPVHSLYEITLLANRFPNNIKQYDVYMDDYILAGITIFETDNVVRSQYGATTKDGEKVRALDYLFLKLIYKYKEEGKLFFSMGTVMDKTRPKGYNEGLLKQKEELGCKIYKQDIYSLKIR